MAININAKTTGVGGLETSADNSGNINIQSGGTTVMSVTSSGVAVTGSFSQNGAVYSTQPSFRNLIINGDMRIDQRNAGSANTINVDGEYTLDRWKASSRQAPTYNRFTVQQVTDAPDNAVNSLKVTSLVSYTLASDDYHMISQYIEGTNIAHLGFGTANAKTVTVSFYVKSSLTGAFGGSLRNSSGTRSYPFSYTIDSANTWEKKTITIEGDTTGTWVTSIATGMILWLGLGVGSQYSGTAGAWSANNYFSTTGATSVVGTSGATWQITGVQLEVGSTATDFENLPYDVSLARCQRYYQLINGGTRQNVTSGVSYGGMTNILVTMRAEPTATGSIYNNSSAFSGATLSLNPESTNSVFIQANATATGTAAFFFANVQLSAEL
jgi:hypothetical protein